MKLLKISDQQEDDFHDFFEEVKTVSLDQIAPEVIDGKPDIKANGTSIDNYDAVHVEINPGNTIFARVMLEIIEEKGIPVNISSTALFTSAKKNYLFYVLHQKNVKCPKTISIASEKAVRGIERNIKGPVIAKRFENLELAEYKKLDTVESIQGFTEGIEYGEEFLLFQEYTSGDKYYCLKIGEKIVSLKDNTEEWQFSKENLKYSNISNDLQETVRHAGKSLGAEIAEIKIRGNQIVDINPKPDLQIYEQKAGQNVYQAISEILKGEDQ